MYTVNVFPCDSEPAPCEADPVGCAAGLGRGLCTVHVCTRDEAGAWIWSGHGPSDVSDGARINPNPSDPVIFMRDGEPFGWQAATPDEAASLRWDADTHRVSSALGAVLEHLPLTDIAATSGFTEQELINEALGWAAAEGDLP